MEWPVEMDLGHGCHMDVFLSIRSNAGEIFLDYTDVTKEQIILDKLSSFNRIEFDENNPLHITFKGPNSTRSFKFKDEDAVSNVWSYLQNFVRFDSIVGKCRAYYIVPLDQKPTIMESAKTLIESIFSRKPSHSPKDLDISPPEAIISNIVHESLSDLHIVELNENNYDEFFDVDGTFKEDVCMSNIEIKFDYSFNLWKRILNINPTEEDSEDYLRLLKQWNPVFENQWKHNFRLRQFVFSLENDLKDSHLPPDLRKLTFEILMSCMYLIFCF
ncbi:hypothetical protein TRFO_39992 [Tritrichomonas foetus]|uniref:Uncharacterized protein n=1 Tax=Tritrichomonas foetus TaxID=1144522 RepID=A0A1J4J924_9EUKA|nr:hypothetical protein TRFO_39992 [Tritrichomonas foetus]|eukprot:OHS93724.1 hypothetical protein TRFO_39992 [Tritrichomonas foetus]